MCARVCVGERRARPPPRSSYRNWFDIERGALKDPTSGRLARGCKGPGEKWRGGSLSDAVISQRPSSFNRDSIVPPCLIYSIERNDQFPFITFYFHRYIYIYTYNRIVIFLAYIERIANDSKN